MNLRERLEKAYPNNKDLNFDKVEKELREFDNTDEAKKQDEILEKQIKENL